MFPPERMMTVVPDSAGSTSPFRARRPRPRRALDDELRLLEEQHDRVGY